MGGAIISSPSSSFIDAVSSMYPGRASMTPILDLFITLLSMGVSGYRRLLQERQDLLPVIVSGLEKFAVKFGLQILKSPRNGISTAVSLPLRFSSSGESGESAAPIAAAAAVETGDLRMSPELEDSAAQGKNSAMQWNAVPKHMPSLMRYYES